MAPNVHTKLMNVSFCWSTNTSVSMYRSLKKNVTYFSKQHPTYFTNLSWMVCEIGGKWPYNYCCRVLLPGFVRNSMQHPWEVPIKIYKSYLLWTTSEEDSVKQNNQKLFRLNMGKLQPLDHKQLMFF